MKVNEYRVWISQINESVFTVRATTEDNAIAKAKKVWLQENPPRANYIVVTEGKKIEESDAVKETKPD